MPALLFLPPPLSLLPSPSIAKNTSFGVCPVDVHACVVLRVRQTEYACQAEMATMEPKRIPTNDAWRTPPPHPFRRGGWGVPVNRRRTYVLHAEAGECRRDRRCRVKNPMPKKKTMLGLMAPQTVDEGTDQGNVNGRFARREKTRRQRWCLPSPATPTTVALSSHSILCGAADVR